MYIIKREHSAWLVFTVLLSQRNRVGCGRNFIYWRWTTFSPAFVCLSASCNYLPRPLDVRYLEAAGQRRLTFELWPLRHGGRGGRASKSVDESGEEGPPQ